MGIFVVGGIFARIFQKDFRFALTRTVLIAVMSSLIGGAIIALLGTYSRGAWAAFFVGVGMLAFSLKKWRRVPVFIALTFLVLLSVFPNGLDRSSPQNWVVDKSVGNRVLVWKGALAMTTEHWLSGVGAKRFGEAFTGWYQPRAMNTRYLTAINDYLTLSAERGIFALCFYLAIIFIVMWIAWRKAKQLQHLCMIGIICAQAAYLTSGIFTYSLTVWEVSCWFWILFAITISYILFSYRLIKHSMNMETKLHAGGKVLRACGGYLINLYEMAKNNSKRFVPPVSGAIMICFLILLAGAYVQADLPVQADFFRFIETGQNQNGVIVYPKRIAPRGVIIWIHGKGGSIREDGKGTLRYLAEKGYIVVSFDYRENGVDGLEDVNALFKWVLQQKQFAKQPVYLAGFSLGARLSILTACSDADSRLRAVASIGSAAEWPFPEISPAEHLYDLKAPLLIVHGDAAEVNPVEQAYMLEKLCKRYRKPYKIVILKNAPHLLDEQWLAALDCSIDFFKGHP